MANLGAACRIYHSADHRSAYFQVYLDRVPVAGDEIEHDGMRYEVTKVRFEIDPIDRVGHNRILTMPGRKIE